MGGFELLVFRFTSAVPALEDLMDLLLLRVGQISGFQQEWQRDTERIHLAVHPMMPHVAAESA